MEVIMLDLAFREAYRLGIQKEGPFHRLLKICLDRLLQEDTRRQRIKTDDYQIHIIMKPLPLLLIKLIP